MPDLMTPAQRSHAMKCVKLRDGPLELLIQQELRKSGLRFQTNYKNYKPLPWPKDGRGPRAGAVGGEDAVRGEER